MASYTDLLLSENWSDRRKEILVRDKSTCTSCSNKELINNSLIRKVGRTQKIKNGYFIYLFDLLNKYDDYFFLSEFQGQRIKRNHLILLSDIHINISDNNFKYRIIGRQPESEIIIDLMVSLALEDNIEKKIQIIESNKPLINSNWRLFRGLEIHHKYYQKGLLPWEYPDEALTTLCYKCHSNLHSTTKISYLDENGNLLTHYTPCKRCCGIGWFKEYQNIENGICFRCNGARYEELINSSNS